MGTGHTHRASRIEASNSPDYFPTPPWATRVLCEQLLGLSRFDNAPKWPSTFPLKGNVSEFNTGKVWEPACGEGHMALPLSEYFPEVFPSDLFDRGFGPYHGSEWDFLHLDPGSQHRPGTFDWIITNPPYRDYAQRFVERAFEHAPRKGIAVFVQLRWLETIERVADLFLPRPPWLIGVFAERVPLVKNRYDPEAGTATAYVWVIWRTDIEVEEAAVRWIAPGQAKNYFRKCDLQLAGAKPAGNTSAPIPLFEDA